MVLENLKSAFDNIIDRFKSPFAGTFIVVWCLHHWILVFSLFNFDASCTLPDKLAIIGNYLGTHSWWNLLVEPIAITFGAIVGFLLLNLFALAISTGYTSIIKPAIIRSIDKGMFVDRHLYLELMTHKEKMDQAYNSLSQNLSLITKEHNELLDIMGELEEEKANAIAEATALQDELTLARPILSQDSQNRTWLYIVLTDEWIITYKDLYSNENEVSKKLTLTMDDMESDAKNVYYNKDRGYLTFDKIKRGEQSRVSTVLFKINDYNFEGIENGAQRFKVTYKKITSPNPLDLPD